MPDPIRPPQDSIPTGPGMAGTGAAQVNAGGDAALAAEMAGAYGRAIDRLNDMTQYVRDIEAFAARQAAADLANAQPAIRGPLNPEGPGIVNGRPIRIPDAEAPTFEAQVRTRMQRFGETAEQATRIVETQRLTPAEYQRLVQEMQALEQQTERLAAQLEGEAAAANRAAGVSAVSRVIRTAGVSVMIVAVGVQLIESISQLTSMNDIERAASALLARCEAIRTMRVDGAGICQLLKAEIQAMFAAIQALERRYRELLPNRRGVIGPAGQRELDRIFDPLIEARARAERRLIQDCFQFETRGRMAAMANPCTLFYVVAIDRLIEALRAARGETWLGPTSIGRAINERTGEGMDMMERYFRTMQQQLYTGAITPANAQRDVARIVGMLDNPATPMNSAQTALAGTDAGPVMTRYNNEYKQAMQAFSRVLAACPAPVIPPPQPPVVLPPGS